VYELNCNWERKNRLLLSGFTPKTLEPQCLIGTPISEGEAPDASVQKAVAKFFDKVILVRAHEIINKHKNICLDSKGEF